MSDHQEESTSTESQPMIDEAKPKNVNPQIVNVTVTAATALAIGYAIVQMGIVPSKVEFDGAIKRQEDRIEQLDDTIKDVTRELVLIRESLSNSASQFEIATIKNAQATQQGFSDIKNELRELRLQTNDRWTFTDELRSSSKLKTDNPSLIVPDPAAIRNYNK
jgi:hypothetical protein